MDDPLPIDVIARLTTDFGERAEAVAALILAHRKVGTGDYLGDRLVRCIVHAASGDEARVQQLLDMAREDDRDVILTGEYNGLHRIRDLRVSFLIDCSQKFWVSGVACLMAARGYRLLRLETRAATAGPFEYTSDWGEGRATFSGPKGEITIGKKDRQWVIHGNRRDIQARGLDHPFGDEAEFCDAVSGYLLSTVFTGEDNESGEAQPQ